MNLNFDNVRQVNSVIRGPEDCGRGRVCMADWCDTVLHRYHDSVFCYVHEHLADEDDRPASRVLEGGRRVESIAA